MRIESDRPLALARKTSSSSLTLRKRRLNTPVSGSSVSSRSSAAIRTTSRVVRNERRATDHTKTPPPRKIIETTTSAAVDWRGQRGDVEDDGECHRPHARHHRDGEPERNAPHVGGKQRRQFFRAMAVDQPVAGAANGAPDLLDAQAAFVPVHQRRCGKMMDAGRTDGRKAAQMPLQPSRAAAASQTLDGKEPTQADVIPARRPAARGRVCRRREARRSLPGHSRCRLRRGRAGGSPRSSCRPGGRLSAARSC